MEDELTEVPVAQPTLIDEGAEDTERMELEALAKEVGVDVPGEDKPEGEPPKDEADEPAEEQAEDDEPEAQTEQKAEEDRIARLEKELEYSRRQQSQIQSFLAKQMQSQEQKQAESLINSLPEDQRKATTQLLDEYFQSRFGEQFDRFSKTAEMVESEQQNMNAEIAIQNSLGKDYEAVKPVLFDYINGLRDKASHPGPEGDAAAQEIQMYAQFPTALADRAKLMYIQSAKGKSEAASEARKAKGTNQAVRATGGKPPAEPDLMAKFKSGQASDSDINEALRVLEGGGYI